MHDIPEKAIPTGLLSGSSSAATNTFAESNPIDLELRVYWATKRLPGMTAPATPTASSSGTPGEAHSKTWLTSRLAGVPGSDNPEEGLQTLMDRLAEGPTSEESHAKLFTLISAGAEITVEDIQGSSATITLSNLNQPLPNQLPLMVGQIVLTACMYKDVEEVTLQDAQGNMIEVPLPNKTTKSGPVTRKDFTDLLWHAPPNDHFPTSDPAPNP